MRALVRIIEVICIVIAIALIGADIICYWRDIEVTEVDGIIVLMFISVHGVLKIIRILWEEHDR